MKKTISTFLVILILFCFTSAPQAFGNEDYRAWVQSDSRWGKISLGESKYTVASSGCLVTSVAKMMIQAEVKSADSFNVEDWALWLNDHKGYTANGDYYWDKAREYTGVFIYKGNLLEKNTYDSLEYNDEIIKWIESGYHMAVMVKNGGHWIAVDEKKSLEEGRVYIMDSAGTPRADVTLAEKYPTFNRISAYKGGSTPFPQVEEYMIGDTNLDKTISIRDATQIQRYLVSACNFDGKQMVLADVNFDGAVDINDVTYIQRYLVGFLTEFKKNSDGLKIGDSIELKKS